jgi:paraquat-inducible protein B
MPDTAESVKRLDDSIRVGIGNGMRATLATGNLLTGAKYVSIDYYEGAPEAEMGEYLGYSTIPTIASGLGQIEQRLAAVLDKVQQLPLEVTVAKGNQALSTLDETLTSLNTLLKSSDTQGLPGELEATLAELRHTIGGLSPESELYQSLSSSMSKLNKSLANLEALTRTLATQPNAVVLPSDPKRDPVPEARQ